MIQTSTTNLSMHAFRTQNVMRHWHYRLMQLLTKKVQMEMDINLMAFPEKEKRDAAINLFLKELEEATADNLLRRMLKDAIHTVRFRVAPKKEREIRISQNVLEISLPLAEQSVVAHKGANSPSLYQILLQIV